MTFPNVTVEAYAGYKGEETPRAFTLDGVRLSVERFSVAGTPRPIAAFAFTPVTVSDTCCDMTSTRKSGNW